MGYSFYFKLVVLIVTVSLLHGCSLIPEYNRPQTPVPSGYTVNDTDETDVMPESWQQYFTDPVLQGLIDIALEQNRDLRIAALRIEEARAQYDIQSSERLPTIDAIGSYDRSRLIFARGQTFDVDMYRIGIGISNFEIDFFGRIKSLSAAVLEDYLATREAQQTARTSLIAEVAVAYVNERALSERLSLAKKTLASREDGYARIRRRFDAGMDTAVDLKTAEMQMGTARAEVAALNREHEQAVHALMLLIGDQSVTLPNGTPPLDTLSFSPLPAGLPSELLERRPDIRAAEHKLKAANANIGAARAALFPRLQLTTNIGLVNERFTKLLSNGINAWAFTPQIIFPIFTNKRNRANVEVARARQEIAVAEYEKAIQSAFREVADTLLARERITKQIGAQSDATEADRERLRLVTRRYEKGVANYLELLDAQRSLFDSEQILVQLKQLSLSNAINLFKALGGEWGGSSFIESRKDL